MSGLSILAKKLAELQARGVKPMFHGGTYARGQVVDRPLYLAGDPGFAETYVWGKGIPGARTKMLFPDVKNTASSDELSEFIRKYLPENEEQGYTPASAFDTSLHDEGRVGRLINKLWDYDFDSARGFDIGMDAGQGGHEGEVLIMLPGTKAYAEGGSVKDERSALQRIKDAVLRGGVGGTLGAPMDIASLLASASDAEARMMYGDQTPALNLGGENPVGGSEWLGQKMKDYGMVGSERNAVDELLAGIATPFAPAAINKVRSAASTAGASALPYLQRTTDALGVPPTAATMSNVIKPKGGQWLSGSVEDALRGLKRPDDGVYMATVNSIPEPDQKEFINWLNDPEMIDIRARNVGLGTIDKWARETGRAPYPAAVTPASSVNDWIDKQLTRYVKTDMATPDDPIRALAERGVLHVDPAQLNVADQYVSDPTKYMQAVREGEGFAPLGMGKSVPARTWEAGTDVMFGIEDAGTMLRDPVRAQRYLADNPWIAKVPPETRIYGVADPTELRKDTGFDHLIDELRNAINPESGLPPELLLKYDSLPRVSVPQAVERVAKINQWRADQKVAANLALANNAATQVVKEYPEQGFKWVELRKPQDTGKKVESRRPFDPDDYADQYEYDEAFRAFANEKGMNVDELEAEDYNNLKDEFEGVSSNMEAAFDEDEAVAQLRNALKYEGDTMGHCVGGYCDDVASGATRIYSLRDAKGQPHVTIEVQKERPSGERAVAARQLTPENYSARYGDDSDLPLRIVQIKGKGNKKPKDDYIPFVQDFVKTQGQWSDVGDFANTDLIRRREPTNIRIGNTPFDLQPGIYSQQELIDLATKSGADPDVARMWSEGFKKGFAEGGHVKNDPFLPDFFEDPQAQQDVRDNTGRVLSTDYWMDLANAPREWLRSNVIIPLLDRVEQEETAKYAHGGPVRYDVNIIQQRADALAKELGL